MAAFGRKENTVWAIVCLVSLGEHVLGFVFSNGHLTPDSTIHVTIGEIR